MRAWVVHRPAPVGQRPLERAELADPRPAAGEVRVQVHACGVCRTDLHVAEGDLAPRRSPVVPGHEIVGTVDAPGPGTRRVDAGDRVGVAWLHRTCGRCRFCRSGRENLCLAPEFTGWTRDGGYAEYVVAPEEFVYPLPDEFDDVQAAPLLCAGIIGYRALRRAELPPGGRLGVYGFGASAHLTAQLALAAGAELYVVTRSAASQDLARNLGAVWVGGPDARPPVPLDAAITFAPAGETVPAALAALDRGGRLAVAGIHLTDIPSLDYQQHLFQERELVSVTANTRADGEEFLRVAARIGLRLHVTAYPFDRADRALDDLAHGRFAGVAVLDLAAR